MSPINSFNNLFLIENFCGIYRNYFNEDKTKKYFIIFLTIVQIVLYTTIIICELYLLLGEVNINQLNLIYAGFSVAVYFSTATSIITGIYYSGTFISYFKSITNITEYLKDDKELIHSLKKTYWMSVTFIIYSITLIVLRCVDTFIKFSELSLLILIPILIAQIMTRVIIMLQYLMLYVVVMIVVHLCKSLTSLVSAAHLSLGNHDVSRDGECYITKKRIQVWVEPYQELANCYHKVMLCFGRQLFLSIILSTSHYILMMYYIIYETVFKIGDHEEYTRVMIILFGYVSLLMLPLIAGQRASNEGAKFRRVLVQLYNTMTIESNKAEVKSLKDFIRLIKERPIEIKLLTNVSAGMYLLPVILTLAVNYLIIMLQFNHVI